MNEETRSLSTSAGDVDVFVVVPEGSGPFPAVIVIEEVWGVNDHIRDVCRRYAGEGFLVLSPEIIDKEVLNKMAPTPELVKDMWGDDEEKKLAAQAKMRAAAAPIWSPDFGKGAIAKLKACVDEIFKDKRFNGNLGVLGFCFGGSYSFQLAMHDDRLKAAVPFYGQVPDPIDDVAKISCPVLNFNGAHDAHIMEKLPSLVEAMKKYNKEYTSVVYPDAGHAFFNDTNTRAYRADDAKDAWEKSVAFLKKNL